MVSPPLGTRMFPTFQRIRYKNINCVTLLFFSTRTVKVNPTHPLPSLLTPFQQHYSTLSTHTQYFYYIVKCGELVLLDLSFIMESVENVSTTSPSLLRPRPTPPNRLRSNTTRLPTPPPDPRSSATNSSQEQSGEDFAAASSSLPAGFRILINRSHERELMFHKQLQQSLAQDCSNQCHGCSTTSMEVEGSFVTCSSFCKCCQKVSSEFGALLEPLQDHFQQSLSAVLCTYGAIEQLNRLYTLWDHYLTIDRDLQRRRECLNYLKLLQNKVSLD